MEKTEKRIRPVSIDADLLARQLDAMLASSFRDEHPEECEGLANLLGEIVSAKGNLGRLLFDGEVCDEMNARFAVPFAMDRDDVADEIKEHGGDPNEAAVEEAFGRIAEAGLSDDFFNGVWWSVLSDIVESVVKKQADSRRITLSDMDLGSFGWALFRWECGGDSDACGVDIATGDTSGFRLPVDDDAKCELEEWLAGFRKKVLEKDPWPSREAIESIWREHGRDARDIRY